MVISIIIPIYEVEDYITECLHSVIDQDYTGRIECILVDDCGCDKSIAIAKDLITKNTKGNISFTILRHQQNRGLSAARNTGIDAANGDYVYFLDSDDTISPDAIRLMAEPLQGKRYDFVVANYQMTGTNDSAPAVGLKEREYLGNEAIVNSYHTQWFVMAWNKLISLEFIQRNNLYFQEGLIREDELWSFKLACVATSMYVINNRTYNYRLREDSIMTGGKAVNRIQAMIIVLKEWVKIANYFNFSYARNHLYYLLEMEKRNNYIESLSCMNLHQRIKFYKELRLLRLPFPYKINLKNRTLIILRDLHSSPVIPTFVGFAYMEFMARIICFIRKHRS